MEMIARRRQRLIVDYEFQTLNMLAAHIGFVPRPRKVAVRCFSAFQRQFLPHYLWSPPHWRVWIRQFAKERALPDIGVIGPIKSGTSDLAVTLMSHPNILSPLVKEFNSTDPLAWKVFYPTLKSVRRHAQRHGVALCPFVGPYLHALDVAITLSVIRPHAKLIINLRNPAELVFSQWKWFVLQAEKQFVDRIPFLATFTAFVDNAIEMFPEAPSPFGPALHTGIYAGSVAHWLQAFGQENVHVFDIADYFRSRNAYFEHLQNFLGLPYFELPPRLPVTNSNPLEGLASPPETTAKLREFFEPYNRRLWQTIGTTYAW